MTNAPLRVGAGATLTLTQIPVRDLAKRVLVVGDPARARIYSALLDGGRLISQNREYVTFTGTYQGTEVSIVSHGVGAPGAVVAFEELCRAGVERIVRAGTAGGLQPDVVDGSLVVATAAVREDGLTGRLVPLSFPAVADSTLVESLAAHASTTGLTVHRGIVLTSALFYPHDVLGGDHLMWQRAGCLAVEMEIAPLLITAALHEVAAAAVLAIDGNPLAEQDDDMSGYQPFREIVDTAVAGAVECALKALVA